MTGKPNPVLLDLPAELPGERIVLRPFSDDDAPALWDAVDSLRPQLKPWMPWVNDHTSLAFDRLQAERVEIRCDALNRRSAAVPRRLGFIHEGDITARAPQRRQRTRQYPGVRVDPRRQGKPASMNIIT